MIFDAGALDTAFGEEGVASIAADTSTARLTDVAITPDGRIIVTGTSRDDGTLNVARFHADGSLDPTFGDGGRATSQIRGDAEVLAAAVQADHKIVVVGQRGREYFVLRYNTNGKHDRTFGDGGIVRRTFGQNVSEARDVVILDDGSILVAGNARQANGSFAAGVARFDPDGTLDQTFGDNGTVVTKFGTPLADEPGVIVNRIAVRENAAANDIVLAGRFTGNFLVETSDQDAVTVMRLHGDGSIDRTFGNDGIALADFGATNEEATGVAVDAQGRPVVSVRGPSVFGALRLRASGARDTTFGRNGLARASTSAGDTSDVLIAEDAGDDEGGGGRIVLAGTILTAPRVARLLPTGALDDDFGTGGLTDFLPFASPADVRRVVESLDGTYVVGGSSGPDQRPPVGVLALTKVFSKNAPAARLVFAPNLTSPRTGSQVFRVQWRGAGGIDVATIGPGDVRVTGPNGYARGAVLVSPPTVRATTDVVARYKVAPPNGTDWTRADNGTYTIDALVGGVQSLQGVPSAAATLGTFRVEIA